MTHISRNEIVNVNDDIGNRSTVSAIYSTHAMTMVLRNPNNKESVCEIYDITTTEKESIIASGTKGKTMTFAISAYTDTDPKVYILYGSVLMYAERVVTKSSLTLFTEIV